MMNLYMVMEYMPGGDFFFIMDNFNLSEDCKRLYVAEMVIAIDVIHSMGFIHRYKNWNFYLPSISNDQRGTREVGREVLTWSRLTLHIYL